MIHHGSVGVSSEQYKRQVDAPQKHIEPQSPQNGDCGQSQRFY